MPKVIPDSSPISIFLGSSCKHYIKTLLSEFKTKENKIPHILPNYVIQPTNLQKLSFHSIDGENFNNSSPIEYQKFLHLCGLESKFGINTSHPAIQDVFNKQKTRNVIIRKPKSLSNYIIAGVIIAILSATALILLPNNLRGYIVAGLVGVITLLVGYIKCKICTETNFKYIASFPGEISEELQNRIESLNSDLEAYFVYSPDWSGKWEDQFSEAKALREPSITQEGILVTFSKTTGQVVEFDEFKFN